MKKKILLSFLFLIIAFSGIFMIAKNASAFEFGPFMIPSLIEDITGFSPTKFLGNTVVDLAIVPIIKGLLYVVGAIAAFLFWVGAQLIAFFMSLNMAIFEMPLVDVGWRIVRDIANLGFVLAIIVIAIATIVRYEDYGTKKLLPKLIAAAILVNFSLTIGAVFIDFSHTLTNFFISKSSSGGDVFGLVTNLANGFAPQKLLQHAEEGENFMNSYEGIITKGIAAVISLFAAALFTFISALSLLGIAIMLLVRFMYLSVLLLVSPIIYLFWVIPSTESVWKSWWHSFMKWVFNAPILTSFLYLTVISTKALSDWGKGFAGAAGSKIYDSASLTPEILIIIGNALIMTGLLVGSLMIANSLGITGATTAYGLASKAGKSAKGWAMSKSKSAATRAGRSVATTGTKTDKDGNTTTALERFGGKYGKIPLIGRAITGISGVSSSARATSSKGVDERIKGLENRTGDDLVALTSRKGLSSEELAATGIAAAKKGKWNDLSEETRKSVIDAARKTKTGDKLSEQVPWVAGELGENEVKIAAKMNEVPKSAIYEKRDGDGNIMNGPDGKPIKEVDPRYEKFVQDNAMNFPTQFKEELGKLPKDTGQAVRDAFENGLKDKVKNIEVEVYDAATKTFKKEGGYAGMEKANETIDTLKRELDPLQADIDDLRDKADKPRMLELKKQQSRTPDEEKEFKDLTQILTDFDEKKKQYKEVVNEIKQQTEKIKKAKDGFEREEARAVSKLDDIAKDSAFKKKRTP